MNYSRSREALLVATAERVVSLHLDDMARIDRESDLSSVRDPLTEPIAASLLDAATRARDRCLAIFELQLEARRRPVLAAALARLESVAVAFTTDEHAALGVRVSPEAMSTLMTLYGGRCSSSPPDRETPPGHRPPDRSRHRPQRPRSTR